MRDLHRFLENPFDDPNISLAHLLAFSTDHLQRMSANNASGELNDRITATTSAIGLVADHAGDDQTALGLRKAAKMGKDAFRKGLPAQVAQIMAAVVAKYGTNSPVIAECCPQGRGIFGSCTDDECVKHVQTLFNGVKAHQADLGAPLLAQVQALKDGWTAVYDASESSGGAKSSTEDAKRLARENLQLMLFLNLLKLAEMFARQPEKLDLYMQQSLLENHPHQPPPAPPAAPKP